MEIPAGDDFLKSVAFNNPTIVVLVYLNHDSWTRLIVSFRKEIRAVEVTHGPTRERREFETLTGAHLNLAFFAIPPL